MVGKEKHVVAVLHFTGLSRYFTWGRMQLAVRYLVSETDFIYTAIIQRNIGRGELIWRISLR